MEVDEWYQIDDIDGLDSCGALVHDIVKRKNGKYDITGNLELYIYNDGKDKKFQTYFKIKNAKIEDW